MNMKAFTDQMESHEDILKTLGKVSDGNTMPGKPYITHTQEGILGRSRFFTIVTELDEIMQKGVDFLQFQWSNLVHMKRHNMDTRHRIPEQHQTLFREVLLASLFLFLQHMQR